MKDTLIFETYSRPELKDADTSSFRHREASRGVVVLPNGKLAIFLKSKYGQYKLPGGGKEGDETPLETFIREVYEEAGYSIKNIRELGFTREVRDDYYQISHVFIAEADTDSGDIHPDAAEVEEGAMRLELTPDEAIERIDNFLKQAQAENPDELPHYYFVSLRDFNILKYCLPLLPKQDK